MPTRLYRLFTFLFFRKHFDTHESTYNDLELETIREIKWPQVENISYVSMRSNLVIAYRYLKYQEDIWKDAYTLGLILGILIIIIGIILTFLENFIMGPVLMPSRMLCKGKQKASRHG